MSNKVNELINGINVEGLENYKRVISENAEDAMIDYRVKLQWLGGTKSKVTTQGITLGKQEIKRNFSFEIDEPPQLLGNDSKPTPQEYLLGGFGACMVVGYTVGAAVKGIKLEKLEIDIEGGLDLRGFLEVNPTSPIGMKEVKYIIRVKADGSEEDLKEIHQKVIETSPNRATIADEVKVVSELVIEK
ncbi:putative OsmC-like protein [Neobacillus niacini]|uniref:OsmC family protein n=1 Tax=Neobacillus niacini TaxID=86668 RepID=UPI00285A5941|nr:OsmC family protein [Neobacillus niacini]MDR7079763.1 putative OsmC-like protein [Neobacillus niacini]